MDSRSRQGSSGTVAPAGLLLGVLGIGWFDARLLAGYATVLVAAAAVFAVRRWLGAALTAQAVSAVGAGIFPGAALQYGEQGVMWAVTVSLLLTAGAMVFAGPGRHLVDLLATQLLLTISAGTAGGFLVLVRVIGGPVALVSVLAMLTGFSAVLRWRAAAGAHRTGALTAAAAVCVVVGTMSLRLADLQVSLVSGAAIGAAVGLAAALGAVVADSVAGRAGGVRAGGAASLSRTLQAALAAVIAVPVYFYGLMLYVR